MAAPGAKSDPTFSRFDPDVSSSLLIFDDVTVIQ